MKVIYLVPLCLMFSPAARAQSTASPPAMNSQPALPQAPTLTENCLRFYPPAAVQAGLQGTTVVVVHLLTDGTMTNPHVARSSGYDLLDQAAIACLQNAKTSPRTHNGIPLELDEKLAIAWQISSPVFAARPNGISNLCGNHRLYPPVAIRLNHEGDTLVSFVVAGDGTVKNVAVARSSGYPELDQASMDCVSTFRYEPATANGKLIEFDEQVEMTWRLR